MRITGIREGVLFLPFHYGYWDAPDGDGHHRAANELTPTTWDPASKQPLFKSGAARLTLSAHRPPPAPAPAPAPTVAASAPVRTTAAPGDGSPRRAQPRSRPPPRQAPPRDRAPEPARPGLASASDKAVVTQGGEAHTGCPPGNTCMRRPAQGRSLAARRCAMATKEHRGS
ncbi:molybdopterin dinucleotide binding domain-containing protein [Streptomyces sp. NPDC127106]|uniref:molybdopterin dinucleotide binding domain-containing protein n=1 Tax=Streptomyces sp. NPDC127106 TaxID=3345360 RepID=UPI0036266B75